MVQNAFAIKQGRESSNVIKHHVIKIVSQKKVLKKETFEEWGEKNKVHCKKMIKKHVKKTDKLVEKDQRSYPNHLDMHSKEVLKHIEQIDSKLDKRQAEPHKRQQNYPIDGSNKKNKSELSNTGDQPVLFELSNIPLTILNPTMAIYSKRKNNMDFVLTQSEGYQQLYSYYLDLKIDCYRQKEALKENIMTEQKREELTQAVEDKTQEMKVLEKIMNKFSKGDSGDK